MADHTTMDHDVDAASRTQRAVAAPGWVTPVEASFLARVPLDDVRTWVESGRVEQRPVGRRAAILVRTIDVMDEAERRAQRRPTQDSTPRRIPARPPVEALPERRRTRAGHRRRFRTGRVVLAMVAVLAVVGGAVVAVLGPGWIETDRSPRTDVPAPAGGELVSVSEEVVGRDPFASPFGGEGAGEVVVKPPVAIRHGSSLSAAAIVVNQSRHEPLPPTQLVFVAHDATGEVVGRHAAVVSLDPARSTTVVAERIDVGDAGPVTIEAKLMDRSVARARSTREPEVRIVDVRSMSDGRSVTGRVDVRTSGPGVRIGCALFDGEGELAAVGFATLRGRERSFRIATRPVRSGPYDASCFAG